MHDLTPRPTEYRGVQYRSKCEAMFALWLDLRHHDGTLIEYEPDWAIIKDYCPDFAIHKPEIDYSGDVPIFLSVVELIEYKPSRPTMTYCKAASRHLMRIARSRLSVDGVKLILPMIYFGSVYSEDRGIFLCNDSKISFGHFMKMNWLTKYEKQIRDYRFDLLEGE